MEPAGHDLFSILAANAGNLNAVEEAPLTDEPIHAVAAQNPVNQPPEKTIGTLGMTLRMPRPQVYKDELSDDEDDDHN